MKMHNAGANPTRFNQRRITVNRTEYYALAGRLGKFEEIASTLIGLAASNKDLTSEIRKLKSLMGAR